MTATTAQMHADARVIATNGVVARLVDTGRRLGTLLRQSIAQRPHATRVAHELNCLADRYQASQPFEAAELRAAAQAYLAAALAR